METKVKVTADPAGNVIVKSKNNLEWGYIRVEQSRLLIDESGIGRDITMSALIPGTIATLSKFNWSADQEIEGRIIFVESTKAFRKFDADKDVKVAGASGILCTIEGSPIYRKNFYKISSLAVDTAVAHDNGDEISLAYAAEKEKYSSSSTEQTFDL